MSSSEDKFSAPDPVGRMFREGTPLRAAEMFLLHCAREGLAKLSPPVTFGTTDRPSAGMRNQDRFATLRSGWGNPRTIYYIIR